MGIGQPNYADYRYRLVDYLSPMYMYKYVMASKKPDETDSYDTIVYPFDPYCWLFTICTILAEFLLLVFAQNLWCSMNDKNYQDNHIYEGQFTKFNRYQDQIVLKFIITCRYLFINRIHP